jgi:hypothetical protein
MASSPNTPFLLIEKPGTVATLLANPARIDAGSHGFDDARGFVTDS